jgi:O-antigen ligase
MVCFKQSHRYMLILFCAVLLEIFIGGGVGLIRFNDIPLRMVLMAIYWLFFIFFLTVRPSQLKLNLDALLIFIIIMWTVFSALVGLWNNNEIRYIYDDVKPMMYFLIYFPMKATVDYYRVSYKVVYKILLVASIVMSTTIIAIYIKSSAMNSALEFELYKKEITDFLGVGVIQFRSFGEGIFYSGMHYLVVTNIFILYFFTVRKLSIPEWLIFYVNAATILISNTKGLIVMMVIGCGLVITCGKVKRSVILFIFAAIVIMFIEYEFFGFDRLNFNAFVSMGSHSIRWLVFNQSLDFINEAPVIGNGFGVALESRLGHQENSYVDILVEQGLVGLGLYVLLFYQVLRGLLAYKNTVYLAFASYILGLIVTSATNPYINNPMGIILIVLAMIYKKEASKVRE